MTFEAWLTANGYDAPAILAMPEGSGQRKHLALAHKAETQPAPDAKKGGDSDSTYEQQVEASRREASRQQQIREMTQRAMQANAGNRDKIDRFDSLCKTAIEDNWAVSKFELHMLREERTLGPMVLTPKTAQVSDDVVEAAICLSHKLPNIEKSFSAETLDSAHKQFRSGMGLKRFLMMGARQNGYRGDDSDWYGVCRAAMRSQDNYEMSADVGPSTGIQTPGILSNIANKFLAMSFMNVEQSWRGIAKIRPVSDFKQTTTYRMSGANSFLRVAPSGEIKHGALSETSYTNQAKTYGRMLGISREDYINDDLGAFINVTRELGRGAADGLNNIFWATWLADSSFFNTDKSKLNYDDGAVDSVLSLAGLDNAESIFAVQTKPDGTPLGATPKILLVPPALKNTAMTLMKAQDLVVGTTPASGPNTNIFAGRYEVVSSAFLPRTSLNDENGVSQTVSGSSTAWYLLADPMDIPCIEVVFLFGKDVPTVESGQFEFDRLGLATRAFYDFGVSLQEYRGGVKLKGAA